MTTEEDTKLPIIMTKDSNRGDEEYFAYVSPSPEEVYAGVQDILDIFSEYLKARGLTPLDGRADNFILGRIIVRVDQRNEYFKIYHANTRLSEMRRAGLLAYWILKYRPFGIETADKSKWQNKLKVNEAVALHMILGMVSKLAHGNSEIKLMVSPEYCRKILHGFREQELSKEAFMIVADSLLENVRP